MSGHTAEMETCNFFSAAIEKPGQLDSSDLSDLKAVCPDHTLEIFKCRKIMPAKCFTYSTITGQDRQICQSEIGPQIDLENHWVFDQAIDLFRLQAEMICHGRLFGKLLQGSHSSDCPVICIENAGQDKTAGNNFSSPSANRVAAHSMKAAARSRFRPNCCDSFASNSSLCWVITASSNELSASALPSSKSGMFSALGCKTMPPSKTSCLEASTKGQRFFQVSETSRHSDSRASQAAASNHWSIPRSDCSLHFV